PEVIGASLITASAVVVLPDPDSPTSAIVLPRWTSRETPSTAWTTSAGRQPPRPRAKWTRRSRIESRVLIARLRNAPRSCRHPARRMGQSRRDGRHATLGYAIVHGLPCPVPVG